MAIATSAEIWHFGTLASVDDGTTSAIASGGFSVAADLAAWTNTDDVLYGRMLLKAQWATVTGVANRSINIYARPINVSGTDDVVVPSTNYPFFRAGYFTIYAAVINTDYFFVSTLLELPSIKTQQEFEFYIENMTNQIISANWTLQLRPLARGPHA